MSDYMRRLIEINVTRDVAKIVQMTAGANVLLANVEPGVKSQTLTNLRRGHTSSLSGEAFSLYQVLSCVFDFPVYAVGRAEMCMLSINEGITPSKDALVKDLRAMWKLANPDAHHRDYGDYWWNRQTVDGHRPGWVQMTVPRPKQLTMQALCHMLQVNSVFDIVNKQNTMRAAVALEQGEVINITPYLRRTS
jgi:hypothetical protein